ncbi:MAG TPA: MBL fold metallo-hydrolase [Propionibacteriaceae bacterium]|nr:MBL fold metallo-hydrolase [Propionibacteriaceae bacterium]
MFTLMSSCGPWEANCYLVGADLSDECVLVDVGMDASAEAERLIGESGRTLVGVLASHGHLDHVADAHVVADAHEVPVWIHAADRHLLSDPVAGLGPQLRELVEAMYGSATLPEPVHVREWSDGDRLELAGLSWDVLHTPGHTPGSVLLHATDGTSSQVFTGDVLFAGSIGRMDLPGGSMPRMVASLRDVVLTLPYDLAVLPGHGAATTIGRECATNPYLHLSFLEQNS